MTKKGMVHWWVSVNIVTGSIARSAKHRYLSNSEADFEVLRPAGLTRCTDGGEMSIDCKKNCNWKWKFATGNRN